MKAHQIEDRLLKNGSTVHGDRLFGVLVFIRAIEECHDVSMSPQRKGEHGKPMTWPRVAASESFTITNRKDRREKRMKIALPSEGEREQGAADQMMMGTHLERRPQALDHVSKPGVPDSLFSI